MSESVEVTSITDWISALMAAVAATAAVVSVWFSREAKRSSTASAKVLRRSEYFTTVASKREAYQHYVDGNPELLQSQNYSRGSDQLAQALEKAISKLVQFLQSEYAFDGSAKSIEFAFKDFQKIVLAYPDISQLSAKWTMPKDVRDQLETKFGSVNSPSLQLLLKRFDPVEGV